MLASELFADMLSIYTLNSLSPDEPTEPTTPAVQLWFWLELAVFLLVFVMGSSSGELSFVSLTF